METQFGSIKNDLGKPVLVPLHWKIWVMHVLVGMLVGMISYVLFVEIYSDYIHSYMASMGPNGQMMVFVDMFLLPSVCLLLPSLVVSGWGGWKGGEIGGRKGHEYLGAVLGGLFSQTINILILAVLVAIGTFGSYFPVYFLIPGRTFEILYNIYQ